MQTKAFYNLHIYIDADDIKDAISRLRLYYTPAMYSFAMSTHVCNVLIPDFFWKSPGLNVVSDPRNVLRDKQGRLIIQKVGILIRSRYNDGFS